MNNKNLPSVSCVVATFNSQDTAGACLKSLFSQNYPKEKLEVIIADGGSKDKTLDILKEFDVNLYKVPLEKQEAEYNKGVAVSHAKNELILFIDIDNVLPHKNWLKKMVRPMVENEKLVGCEVLRFHYNSRDYILDRYFALIGGVDPVPYYLGKDSKLSWAFDKYNLRGKSKDCGDYYLVKFEANRIPTIGANGFILRKKFIKYTKHDPDHFFHTDINRDLIIKGFNTYAFVKDDIIHFKRTKFSYFLKFLIRRKYIMETQYFENLKKRRYAVFMSSQDKLGLLKFVLYSITVVKPLYDSFRGFMKVKDFAWFIHPLVCLAFLFTYSFAVVPRAVRKMV